ncbi:TIR domain-containing protein [Sphingomonas agri]|uniref:TIR domain-containing protein n=1 Tax=Sphingomonas agri TaxID=1813878 RepID=UPI00311F765B
MSDVFISYARSTEKQAERIAVALRAHGHQVWRDTQLRAHQVFRRTIEEELSAARAVLVLWSAEAAQSDWVCSEASRARGLGKLVQLTLDGSAVPMPFDEIQCADLRGWRGETDAQGWTQILDAIAAVLGNAPATQATQMKTRAGRPSIAIMPFANIAGDPQQEYFVDGMLEEIATALSRIRTIFVIAGGSSLSLKGKDLDPQEVGRRLGVAYLLEGSVRRDAGRVRIAVKLIDAADGAQLWAERFEDSLEDVFALQDRVALTVAGRIEPSVQEAEIRKMPRRPTENMSSYDLYLRAWPLHRAYTKPATLDALELIERAVALDPNYGPALALGAVCHNISQLFEWSEQPEEDRRRGIEMAHQALAVASDDADVLANAASVVAGLERDVDAAITLCDKAIALNPGSPIVWFMSGIIHLRIGHNELAIEHLERAMHLDPIGPDVPNQVGLLSWARFQQGRFADAVALGKEFVRQKPHPRGYAFLAASYGQLGLRAEAQDALKRYADLATRSIESFADYMIVNASGRRLFLDGIALARTNSPPGNS